MSADRVSEAKEAQRGATIYSKSQSTWGRARMQIQVFLILIHFTLALSAVPLVILTLLPTTWLPDLPLGRYLFLYLGRKTSTNPEN